MFWLLNRFVKEDEGDYKRRRFEDDEPLAKLLRDRLAHFEATTIEDEHEWQHDD